MHRIKLTLLAIFIILLSLGIFSACAEEQPTQTTPLYPESYMNADEVINIVLVYGVPALTDYPFYGRAQSVGQWAAVYEGEGKWRIQGSVTTQSIKIMDNPRDTIYWSTTWEYSNNQVKLIDYNRN